MVLDAGTIATNCWSGGLSAMESFSSMEGVSRSWTNTPCGIFAQDDPNFDSASAA